MWTLFVLRSTHSVQTPATLWNTDSGHTYSPKKNHSSLSVQKWYVLLTAVVQSEYLRMTVAISVSIFDWVIGAIWKQQRGLSSGWFPNQVIYSQGRIVPIIISTNRKIILTFFRGKGLKGGVKKYTKKSHAHNNCDTEAAVVSINYFEKGFISKQFGLESFHQWTLNMRNDSCMSRLIRFLRVGLCSWMLRQEMWLVPAVTSVSLKFVFLAKTPCRVFAVFSASRHCVQLKLSQVNFYVYMSCYGHINRHYVLFTCGLALSSCPGQCPVSRL